jgi:hypothetical protein
MLGGRREIGEDQRSFRQASGLDVCAPLPVRTSSGWAPTAAAACRSRRESPTAGTPDRSTLKQSAMRTYMPGLGLRQEQCASTECGQ